MENRVWLVRFCLFDFLRSNVPLLYSSLDYESQRMFFLSSDATDDRWHIYQKHSSYNKTKYLLTWKSKSSGKLGSYS